MIHHRSAPLLAPAEGAPETRIVLDDADSGRVFEGVGVVSAGASTRNLVDYPEKLRAEVLDYMFKPKFGANLQHLKVEIGGGENSTCGTEPTHVITREELKNPVPRGYEFWLMTEARQVYNKNYIRSRITKNEVWCMLSGVYPGVVWFGAGLMEAHSPWSGFFDVYPAVWTTDYTIQADVLVTAGKAGIGGRYWCGEQRGAGLVLQQDCTWWIEASVEAVEVVDGKENKLKVSPLAIGKIDGFIPATRHHLTLVLKGDELTASIDSKEVPRVRYEKFYPAHKSGRAYLMSSYDPNCFDDLSVTP